MELSREQKKMIAVAVSAKLSPIFTDFHDRAEVVDAIMADIISDIEDTADWSGYCEDEYNLDDIEIALARVLKNKICG